MAFISLPALRWVAPNNEIDMRYSKHCKLPRNPWSGLSKNELGRIKSALSPLLHPDRIGDNPKLVELLSLLNQAHADAGAGFIVTIGSVVKWNNRWWFVKARGRYTVTGVLVNPGHKHRLRTVLEAKILIHRIADCRISINGLYNFIVQSAPDRMTASISKNATAMQFGLETGTAKVVRFRSHVPAKRQIDLFEATGSIDSAAVNDELRDRLAAQSGLANRVRSKIFADRYAANPRKCASCGGAIMPKPGRPAKTVMRRKCCDLCLLGADATRQA